MAAYTSPRKRPAPKRKARSSARRAYHHGNLVPALIEAALQLVQEGGLPAVTVREAARRAGVSPGAPFRHFPTRMALMTAVAEHAMAGFHRAIMAGLAAAPAGDPAPTPIARIRAIGRAYVRWALQHSAPYQVISAHDQIDYAHSPTLRRLDGDVRAAFAAEVEAAMAQGLIHGASAAGIQAACRAMVHGLARMQADGIFPRWGVTAAQAEAASFAALDLLIAGLMRPT